MKITISSGRNDTFDSKVNFIRGVSWSGKWVHFWLLGGIPPISKVSYEGLGGQWGIILGDNPAGM